MRWMFLLVDGKGILVVERVFEKKLVEVEDYMKKGNLKLVKD